ncbi:Ltp family lipoprotein [Fructilactobacillus frigidiflavus]|uniref:Ltp family lipoprotein n=1 Tax=Fructilactobacillus frigidiflavus TaxID=3242688 RepID=UPI0037583027
MSEKRTKKKFYKRWWFWLLAVIIIFIFVGASGNDDKKNTSSSKNKTEKISSKKKSNDNKKNTKKDVSSKNNVAKAKVHSEDDNAYKSARKYMSNSGLSKKGLYEQLTSKSGGKFNPEAATYAINKISEDDYKDAAVTSAKTYSNDKKMSAKEVYQQLTSKSGDKYTPDEAKYAIDKLHLDDIETDNKSDDESNSNTSSNDTSSNNSNLDKPSENNQSKNNFQSGDTDSAQSQKVVGNSKTHIYHLDDQQNYRMSSNNIVYFNSPAEAEAAGYRKSLR